MEERLQKLLAQAGYGSRRSCEELILQGRVRVNGRVAQLGQKADPTRDTITLDGEPLAEPERLTYVLLHKPRGVVSSLEPQGDRKTVVDLVPSKVRLYPVGRLDVESEGLILLTNDGALANRLTHPRYEVEKEYRVLVKGAPDEEQLNIWRRGVVLKDPETGKQVRTLPARVTREGPSHETTWLRVVMREGRKHEIRDIGATLGLPVKRLIRVRLGSLRLGDLKPGEWRYLTAAEVAELKGEAEGAGKRGKPGKQGKRLSQLRRDRAQRLSRS
ncbi:MAG: pseudouridine synthase [Anaerolineales bacterium]|nr:pseudouridine synthase [Anaerolineales bacterium]